MNSGLSIKTQHFDSFNEMNQGMRIQRQARKKTTTAFQHGLFFTISCKEIERKKSNKIDIVKSHKSIKCGISMQVKQKKKKSPELICTLKNIRFICVTRALLVRHIISSNGMANQYNHVRFVFFFSASENSTTLNVTNLCNLFSNAFLF